MNGNHITFEKLSRYMDGDFMPASEKRLIESHLEICPHCAGELSKIRRLVTMVSCLKGIGISAEKRLSAETVRIISTRSGVRNETSALKRHFIPAFAVAAIIIGVIGISIFTTDTLNNFSSTSSLARKASGGDVRVPALPDPASRVMQLLRSTDARILQVSDSYVIGETSPRNINKLKRDMGDYRIQFMSREPRRDVMNVSTGGGDSFNVSTPGMVQFKIFVK